MCNSIFIVTTLKNHIFKFYIALTCPGVVAEATCSHLMFHASIAGVARIWAHAWDGMCSRLSDGSGKEPQNTIFKFREFMCRRHRTAQRWFLPDFSRETFFQLRDTSAGELLVDDVSWFRNFVHAIASRGEKNKGIRASREIHFSMGRIAFCSISADDEHFNFHNFPIFNFPPLVVAFGLIFQLLSEDSLSS